MTQQLSRTSTNFDAVGLAAAVAVIVGHAYYLTARPVAGIPVVWGQQVQTLAVAVFFAVSGYLITDSWQRKPDLRSYLAARILRIFPALIAVVLITSFVIGPLVTLLSPADYFSSGGTYHYLENLALKPVYPQPGVFTTLPLPNNTNSVFWTLPCEFLCYLLVPLIGQLPSRLRLAAFALFGVAAVILWIYFQQHSAAQLYGVPLWRATTVWPYFAVGAVIRLSRHVPRLDLALLLAVAVSVVATAFPRATQYVDWVCVPYLVLAICLTATPVVRQASRFGDFSYGTYLWAFPIQQIVVLRLRLIPLPLDLALVVALAIAAFISWHAIEHPAMRLKDRLRQRVRTTPVETLVVSARAESSA